ncbi:M23 family metallopeptidase [Altererythrobacter xiamenensis]|nr:M23 family metallopeptidase [Altererythrobacter xiamenensis]
MRAHITRMGGMAGALALTVGCTAAASEEPSSVADAPPEPAVASAPQPRPPATAPASAPEPAPHFSYAGELTQGGWIRGQVPRGTVTAKLNSEPIDFDTYGNFFAAFDRDAEVQHVLAAELQDGRTIDQTIRITPRDWDIEHVNVARRTGGPSASFMQRRRPELEQIWAARAKKTGAKGWQQDFIWPVKGRLSGRFGSQRIYRGEPGSYHSGADIATGESGTPFVAPADGVVTLAAQDFSLEGKLLIIDHGNGLNSAFLHASRLTVAEGDMVKQGQQIGNIGSSGRATGPHLHWSIKWKDARLDPLLFVGPMN